MCSSQCLPREACAEVAERGRPGVCANGRGLQTRESPTATCMLWSFFASASPSSRADMSCLLERKRRVGPPQPIRLLGHDAWPPISRAPSADAGSSYPQTSRTDARGSSPRAELRKRPALMLGVCGVHSKSRKSKVPTVVVPPSTSHAISTRHAVASSTLGCGWQERVAALERVGEGHVDGRLRCLRRLVLRIGGMRRWRRGGGGVVVGVMVRVLDERAVLWPLWRTL